MMKPRHDTPPFRSIQIALACRYSLDGRQEVQTLQASFMPGELWVCIEYLGQSPHRHAMHGCGDD